ncbi:MAG: 50S ribosomal protein L32 [Acidithiobacillus sp.]|jgi:large subunit ribosomal protein L32|uniref:Large ribosomal subunit protein bL32 n=1 Tax=Acidithiobacillus ferrivorans TaxID=160808 RepID=A0A257T6N8_9PROT|nr:50S ribosomal protein L32 [Acidithiobacillus sp.]OYV80390.1 MAG: 50S ribosomal protein L32 [Acidithiobacillus ferrivorans]
MAVPQSKTSRSRRDMRRAHDFLVTVNRSVCAHCGAAKLPHHVCPECGFYKGREIVKKAVEA